MHKNYEDHKTQQKADVRNKSIKFLSFTPLLCKNLNTA